MLFRVIWSRFVSFSLPFLFSSLRRLWDIISKLFFSITTVHVLSSHTNAQVSILETGAFAHRRVVVLWDASSKHDRYAGGGRSVARSSCVGYFVRMSMPSAVNYRYVRSFFIFECSLSFLKYRGVHSKQLDPHDANIAGESPTSMHPKLKTMLMSCLVCPWEYGRRNNEYCDTQMFAKLNQPLSSKRSQSRAKVFQIQFTSTCKFGYIAL